MLAGQDEALAQEIVGRHWDPEGLDAFLERAARWRPDGPLREFAALEDAGRDEAEMVGGGGLALLGAGLERGQAALTYWALAGHRGRGHGRAVAAALVDHARAEPRIRELVLRIAPGHHASQAVARSLGVRPTGRTEPHPADASRTADRWALHLAPRPPG